MKWLLLYLRWHRIEPAQRLGAVLLAFINLPIGRITESTTRDYIIVVTTNIAVLVLLLVVLFVIRKTVVRLSRAMRTSTI